MIHVDLISAVVGAGAGFVGGAFCPAVLRKIKALFVKTSADLKVDAAKLQAALEVKLAQAAAAGEKEVAAAAKKV
jgi:hypothetical protein